MISVVLMVLATEPAVPPPLLEQCVADADCIVTTWAGCCGACCPPPPTAMLRSEYESRSARCAAVECAGRCYSKMACKDHEPVSAFRAVCRAGACALDRAVGECATDSDCRVEYPPLPSNAACRSSPCGCCPNTVPIAVSMKSPRRTPDEPPPRPLTRQEAFGVHPGPPPQCSPCPGPPPVRAACVAQRCTLRR